MAATARPALLTPGLKPVDPAFESWWVRPGGATRVRVRPGDRVTVIDPDGGQPAEVVVLGADPEVLGTRADAPASVLIDRELAEQLLAQAASDDKSSPKGQTSGAVARPQAETGDAAPAATT